MKDHNFNVKIVMTSNSEGVQNQEIVLDITEFASTGGELTLKQMAFSRDVIPKMISMMVDSFDEMSKPWQEQGLLDAAAVFEGANKPKGKGKAR